MYFVGFSPSSTSLSLIEQSGNEVSHFVTFQALMFEILKRYDQQFYCYGQYHEYLIKSTS